MGSFTSHEQPLLLLVEDEALVAANTRRALELRGYRVLVASGAAAALERIPVDHPELAIVDIDLGAGGNGAVLAREILARHGIPVVFHTSHQDAASVARISDIDHFGYVTKDAGPEVLDQIVGMALRLSREIEARRAHEEQISRLMRESHERTRADMDMVRSMLAVQRFRSSDGQTQSALYSAEQHLTLLQRIYEEVYQGASVTGIPLPQLVEHLLLDLEPASRTRGGPACPATRPEIVPQVEELEVERMACVPVGIIVLELVGNALRHAFDAGSEEPVIRVVIRRAERQWIEITVIDNGRGLPHSYHDDESGFGLALVSTLAEQFNGSLRMQPERPASGTTATVLMQLPLASGRTAR